MANVSRVSGNAIISLVLDPVMKMMKGLIKKEDSRQILQTDLRPMERLLEYTGIIFRDQLTDPPEIVKIWLQLLQNSLTEANGLFHSSRPRLQSCLACVVCDPGRLSKEIKEWNALFNHLYDGFRNDLIQHLLSNGMISVVVELVLKEDISEEDKRQILQMQSLLLDFKTLLPLQKEVLEEIVKTWLPLLLPLLLNYLIQPKDLLDLSKKIREGSASFERYLYNVLSGNAIIRDVVDPVMKLLKDVIEEDNRQILQTDLRRIETLLLDITTLFRDEPDIAILFLSQNKAFLEIMKTWLPLLQDSLTEAKRYSASFDEIYHNFQSDLSILVTSPQFLSPKALHKDEALLQGVAAPGFVGSGIIDAQAQVERWLKEGDRVHVIGVCGLPGVGKTSLLRMLYNKVSNHVFNKRIWVTVFEYYKMFDLQSAIGHQCGDLDLPDSLDERKMKLSAYLKQENFLLVLDGLRSRLDLQKLGVAFGDDKRSKVLFSTRRKDLIPEMSADESTEIQPLSKEEGWMLFHRLAFKDDQVSVDIQDRGRKIADECRGLPLAIHVVAGAMMGQTSVDKWDICLSSIQNVDPSFPATASGLDAELYAALRFRYDALPNSDVKKCFLYCALYNEEQEIDTLELVQMWIGEGVVKSKQGTYLMDMAVGRKYLKLLVDRCLFQIVKERTNVFKEKTIRVESLIRAMAINIGQKEENCLFMATQNQPNFPEVYDENCRIISLANLPTHLQCPKLASLTLRDNRTLKELPSEFVRSLTSLRILNLSGCTEITSVPTSIEQLRMLEFLSLRDLPIKDLPKEVCRLSKLQSLDLSHCQRLKSLPSEIGEIKNLKCLNLDFCNSLKVLPREISELTSLSRLVLPLEMYLSMETEAPASIWSLKGLKNMTELRVQVDGGQQLKDGIMGSWSEMRHLMLIYYGDEDLPEDMKSMKKLQSFMLRGYLGSSLPNCKFEHLEVVSLYMCRNISDLSTLEWMPNLKLLKLEKCYELRELGIGSRGSGSPSGYQRLQKLVLKNIYFLESLGGASKRGVWDERTVPHLRVLKIRECDSLKRFPVGMEKLPNLCALVGSSDWWESIWWEDENMKIKLGKIFKMYQPRRQVQFIGIR